MLYNWIKNSALKYNKCICDERSTYRIDEYFSKAEKLARSLTAEKYGILCHSELNVGIAVLACLYSGKTAIPLSARYGAKYNDSIISAMKISSLITDQDIQTLSTCVEETEDLSDVPLILCTSGTTGIPKGVMLTDESIMASLNSFISVCKIDQSDTIILTRPLFHCSVIICEFFLSLIKGLNIVFCNKTFDPLLIASVIKQQQITVLGGTPSNLYQLSRFISKADACTSIKTIISSGECMTKKVAQTVRRYFPKAKIYNAYGMTEASPRISCLPHELFDEHPESVGYPLSCVNICIEDGELLISGKNLMKGYYGIKERPTKWFHTGDAATIENGLLYVHGRVDNMIIKHGVNIYPSEIENTIRTHNAIREVVAIGVPAETVSQKIILFAESDCITEKELFDFCVKHLPTIQMPDEIHITDCIPKTDTGKIIRGAYNDWNV